MDCDASHRPKSHGQDESGKPGTLASCAVDVRGRRGLIGSRAPGAGILPSRSCGKFVEQSRDSQWQGDADTSIGRTALSRHSL